MTALKPTSANVPGEHPTDVNKMVEPLSLAEKATFGHDAQRCPISGRVWEQGEGSLSRDLQTQNFLREAALAERKAAIEAEAARQAAAIAAAAEQKPVLRLISTFANARISDFKTDDPEV